MGMVYVLRRATDDQLKMLMRRPALIHGFLDDESREAAVMRTGLWDKLVQTFGFAPSVSPLNAQREDDDEVDLDKSWHLMHFVLTGTADWTDDPLGFLLGSWPQIGKEEVGWGPAWAIDAAGMTEFARAASEVRLENLRHRFDPKAMAEADVYLGDSLEGDEEEGFAYVQEYFEVLRNFVNECARRGCGAVGYLT